jgi:hypothetical protein
MAFWIALAVLLVGVLVGLVVAAVRGFRLWRLAKRTSGAFTDEIDRITQVTGEIESQLARAQESSERLAAATERLAVSKARLDVQLAAVREAREQIARTFWFVPGI